MKKKILFGIGAVLAVALLAGAAYLGMRLLNAKTASNLPSNMMVASGGPGGSGKVSITIQMTPAPELPKTRSDFSGQVKSIDGNSLFVTEQNKFAMRVVQGSNSNNSGQSTQEETDSSSGPTVEVVVAQETTVYRDKTMENVPRPSSGTSTISVQQVVEPADISQIAEGYMVQVWGQKRGERIIADVILVMGPVVYTKKGP